MTIGRKGLNKFFDLKLDYVSKEKRYNENALSAFESDAKNITLAEVKQSFL